jgi:hypothetical protein
VWRPPSQPPSAFRDGRHLSRRPLSVTATDIAAARFLQRPLVGTAHRSPLFSSMLNCRTANCPCAATPSHVGVEWSAPRPSHSFVSQCPKKALGICLAILLAEKALLSLVSTRHVIACRLIPYPACLVLVENALALGTRAAARARERHFGVLLVLLFVCYLHLPRDIFIQFCVGVVVAQSRDGKCLGIGSCFSQPRSSLLHAIPPPPSHRATRHRIFQRFVTSVILVTNGELGQWFALCHRRGTLRRAWLLCFCFPCRTSLQSSMIDTCMLRALHRTQYERSCLCSVLPR